MQVPCVPCAHWSLTPEDVSAALCPVPRSCQPFTMRETLGVGIGFAFGEAVLL